MITRCTAALVCPICAGPLREAGRALACAGGHSFDRAREGYVDLMPVGHGRSRIRGDSAPMLRARRRFLERGHYAPLSDAINEHVTRALGPALERGTGTAMLDAGCGVGYYLGRAVAALPADAALCAYGLDVSRDAARMAARAYRAVQVIVNDVHERVCLADASVDVLLNVFAPRNAPEFARVLRPGALLLVVIPGPTHLAELRTTLPLLGIQDGKQARTAEQLRGGFHDRGDDVLERRVALSADDVADLVAMTPSHHHVPEAQRTGLRDLDGIEVTFSFRLLRFVRSA